MPKQNKGSWFTALTRDAAKAKKEVNVQVEGFRDSIEGLDRRITVLNGEIRALSSKRDELVGEISANVNTTSRGGKGSRSADKDFDLKKVQKQVAKAQKSIKEFNRTLKPLETEIKKRVKEAKDLHAKRKRLASQLLRELR